MPRVEEIEELYSVLAEAEKCIGGKKILSECHGRMPWPTHGIYFFFERGEIRQGGRSENGLPPAMRVVRVGTHAVTDTSTNTLWKRLHSHRGRNDGNGNHRGSIFRLLLGQALIQRDGIIIPPPGNWGVGSSAPAAVCQAERDTEFAVSNYLNNMPFVWLAVPQKNDRREVEEYCIALLSNYNQKTKIDPPSENWLGLRSPKTSITKSGLWNSRNISDHSDGFCIPGFINKRVRPLLANELL